MFEISINEIVAAAGKAKGTFYVHFVDRTDYLVALHRLFHDRLEATLLKTVEGIEPGATRLWRGSQAYLNRCLDEQGVKALLLEARSEPALVAEVRERNQKFARLVEADFEVMGRQPARQSAYLYVTMVAEAALLELQTSQPDPLIRQALAHYIGL